MGGWVGWNELCCYAVDEKEKLFPSITRLMNEWVEGRWVGGRTNGPAKFHQTKRPGKP